MICTMTAMDSVKAKLDEYEYIIGEQMAEIDRLRVRWRVFRLRAGRTQC